MFLIAQVISKLLVIDVAKNNMDSHQNKTQRHVIVTRLIKSR
jgi:hypothetical protein